MKPRARRARKVARDRRRHYQLGTRAFCPQTCVECYTLEETGPLTFFTARHVFDIFATMGQVARLVANPMTRHMITATEVQLRATLAAARGEDRPPSPADHPEAP